MNYLLGNGAGITHVSVSKNNCVVHTCARARALTRTHAMRNYNLQLGYLIIMCHNLNQQRLDVQSQMK